MHIHPMCHETCACMMETDMLQTLRMCTRAYSEHTDAPAHACAHPYTRAHTIICTHPRPHAPIHTRMRMQARPHARQHRDRVAKLFVWHTGPSRLTAVPAYNFCFKVCTARVSASLSAGNNTHGHPATCTHMHTHAHSCTPPVHACTYACTYIRMPLHVCTHPNSQGRSCTRKRTGWKGLAGSVLAGCG